MELSQQTAEEYIQTPKRFAKINKLELQESFDVVETVVSDRYGDIFKFDLKQGRIELKVMKIGTRAHDVFVLRRLDVDNHVHKNPDGKKVKGPHIHVYREGFNDKFAFPVADFGIVISDDASQIISQFMELCNIEVPELVLQKTLKSWKNGH